MFSKELYIKTFSKLKASDDTLMEVLKMTTDRTGEISRTLELTADQSQKTPRRAAKRVAVIAAIVILALSLVANVVAYGDPVITYLGNNVWGMAVMSQEPVKGYSLASKIGEYMAVDLVVDGASIGKLRGDVFSVEERGGRYTLQNVAIDNGDMILIKPGDTNGFSLKKGESISIYAELNTSPRYADKIGELSQVGCYADGEIFYTFTGKLASGGVVFTIVAPCDGEFMIYLTNYCAGLQNYAEISVY